MFYHFIPIFCFFLFFLISCTEPEPPQQPPFKKVLLQGKTMGTRYHISLIVDTHHHSRENVSIELLHEQVKRLLADINLQMSTYIQESEISRFNQLQSTRWFPVSKEFFNVVKTAKRFSTLTHGSFDITAASLVNLWGFGPVNQASIPDSHQINEALQLTGHPLVDIKESTSAIRKLKPLLKIDLSAIAKGYAVDRVSKLLMKLGFNNHLVEIGGEISAKGHNINKKGWQIVIQQPGDKTNLQNVIIPLNNKAIATSGDYRNYFINKGKRYSHTIDPRTGKPVLHALASVTVLDSSAMKADALATALMVMGEEKGIGFVKRNKISAYFIIRQGKGRFKTWTNFKGSE